MTPSYIVKMYFDIIHFYNKLKRAHLGLNLKKLSRASYGV